VLATKFTCIEPVNDPAAARLAANVRTNAELTKQALVTKFDNLIELSSSTELVT
jgi:hypothetical protein